MKALLMTWVGLVAWAASAAKPEIDPMSVSISLTDEHRVQVEYVLSGAPAVVTVEFQTNTLAQGAGNWVKLDGTHVQHLSGDVNRLVGTGSRTFVWRASRDWRGQYIADGRVRAQLTVWATNAPPTYLVCGLTKNGDVRYYEDPDYVPGGISNDLYKTDCLLMRKAPAAGVVWEMGAVNGPNPSKVEGEEQVHLVMLTEDYYVSVYEVTQKQWMDVTGLDPSATKGDTRPLTNVSVGQLRGMSYTSSSSYSYCWPQDGHAVDPDSAIGLLRTKTGLDDFDLPTEAQWECAARAGERNMFANGKNGDVFDPRAICICKGDPGGYTTVQPVGSREPNNWGLYDMQGNAQEYCLDRYTTNRALREASFATNWNKGAVTVDPVGVTEFIGEDHNSQYVIRRGGSVSDEWFYCTVSYQHGSGNWWWDGSAVIGVRLVRPAVAK